jgi:hypothetical protein
MVVMRPAGRLRRQALRRAAVVGHAVSGAPRFPSSRRRAYVDYLASGHGTRDTEARQFIKELETPPSTGELEKDTAAGKAILERGAAYDEKGAATPG